MVFSFPRFGAMMCVRILSTRVCVWFFFGGGCFFLFVCQSTFRTDLDSRNGVGRCRFPMVLGDGQYNKKVLVSTGGVRHCRVDVKVYSNVLFSIVLEL